MDAEEGKRRQKKAEDAEFTNYDSVAGFVVT
jgi:hypothetical protein